MAIKTAVLESFLSAGEGIQEGASGVDIMSGGCVGGETSVDGEDLAARLLRSLRAQLLNIKRLDYRYGIRVRP